MNWHESLSVKVAARAAHVFLLNLNVNDVQLREEGNFCELFNFLLEKDPFLNAGFIFTFNRSEGISLAPPEKEEKFIDFLGQLYPFKTLPKQPRPDAVDRFLNRANRHDPSYLINLFSELLTIGWDETRPHFRRALEEHFGKDKIEEGKKCGAPLFILWIDYTESLAPPQSFQSTCENDRTCAVAFLRWAKNDAIRDAKNVVVLVAEELGNVLEEFASDTNGIMPLEVPFLELDDYLAAFSALQKEFPKVKLGLSVDEAARLATGLSRRNLVQLTREALQIGQPLTEDMLFTRQAKHLKDRSRGLAELIRSYWGRDAIGGLHLFKDYLDEIVGAMRSGDTLAVPQGILIEGPPGTGKTVFVQALAYESRLRILWLPKNFRNMFVGQSEERLKFWFKLIKSYLPLLMAMDEVDQLFLKRGTFFSGDTGVTERLQAMFFEVMSDTDLRGRLLFIGLTNRPQDLDPAMLREGRFDDVLPFLGPQTAEERSQILLAIFHKLERQAALMRKTFRHDLSDTFIEEFGKLAHGHYQEGKGWVLCDPSLCGGNKGEIKEVSYVGGEIEYIATRANRRARRKGRHLAEEDIRFVLKDFLPKRNMRDFNDAVDEALRHANSLEFIPAEFKKRAMEIRGFSSENDRYGQYL